MPDYRVGWGHDLPLGSLTLLAPQPRSTGVEATVRRYSGSGQIFEEGLYVQLLWDVVGSASQYDSLLAQWDFFVTPTRAVTVYIPNPTLHYNRYNGIAVRPETGRDMRVDRFYVRNVVILVRDLVNLT